LLISDHIFKDITFSPSPNIGEKFGSGLPDTIILHYTATMDAARAIYMLSDPAREVSAHLVVDRDGRITQLVPFNTIAWHAGKSKWGERESLNKFSIGIEIVNAGPLNLENKTFLTWDQLPIPNNEVYPRLNNNSEIEYWHIYPKKQIQALEFICKNLISAYNIKEILAHSEIAPDRKIDPGPALNLENFKKLVSTN
jgi:N-acetylmuramoyl-L-alanine amidase